MSELTEDGLRALADRWDAVADQTMERALIGDPAAAMAAARVLRSCAADLRGAVPSTSPTIDVDWRAVARQYAAEYDRLGRATWLALTKSDADRRAAVSRDLQAALQALRFIETTLIRDMGDRSAVYENEYPRIRVRREVHLDQTTHAGHTSGRTS